MPQLGGGKERIRIIRVYGLLWSTSVGFLRRAAGLGICPGPWIVAESEKYSVQSVLKSIHLSTSITKRHRSRKNPLGRAKLDLL